VLYKLRIPVDKIVIPEIRVSAKFTPEQEAFFKASIERLGVIHEPVVRKLPDGKYEIVAGAHRFKELVKRGQREIECKVVEVDDRTSIAMNVIENLARGSYDPIEVSKQLKRYLNLGGEIRELAKMTGHTVDWVKKYISLQELPVEFQRGLSQGLLKIGHVEEAFKLKDEVEIYQALATAMHLKWPVETLRNYVVNRLAQLEAYEAMRKASIEPPPKPEPSPELGYFGRCMCCKRTVKQSELRLPSVCLECYALLNYCLEYLGEPREAMNKIYDAISFKQQYERWQKQQYMMMQQQRMQPQVSQLPQPTQQVVTPRTQPPGFESPLLPPPKPVKKESESTSKGE